MCRSSFVVIRTAVIVAIVVVVPRLSHADARQCEGAISAASAKFGRFYYQALRKCNDAVLKGSNPGPCPDARTSARLAKLNTKLHLQIATNCGGPDDQCGDGDDQPLSTIGWDIGMCPNFENGSCTNAIANCGDIADCVSCIDTAAAEQAIALTYGNFTPAPAGSAALVCQRAIGKYTEKYFSAEVRSLQKCETRVLSGSSSGPCPDAVASGSIAKAEVRKVRGICKACGGPDHTCGGGDDIDPATIGFPSSCPDVTVPHGSSCAASVTDMSGVVACVDCVATFKGDCVDAASVPALTTYPPECNGGVSATATPTPSPPTPTTTPTATTTIPVPTPTVPGPTTTLPLPTLLVTPTLPLPTLTLPLATATSTPATTATPTPTLTLPLPSLTLPLPSLTLPLPSLTLPDAAAADRDCDVRGDVYAAVADVDAAAADCNGDAGSDAHAAVAVADAAAADGDCDVRGDVYAAVADGDTGGDAHAAVAVAHPAAADGDVHSGGDADAHRHVHARWPLRRYRRQLHVSRRLHVLDAARVRDRHLPLTNVTSGPIARRRLGLTRMRYWIGRVDLADVAP